MSSAVCANIFLRPAIARLSGGSFETELIAARLGTDLPENDRRQDYLRSTLTVDADGNMTVEPARKQDSSMIGIYAHANALIVRSVRSAEGGGRCRHGDAARPAAVTCLGPDLFYMLAIRHEH